MSVKTRPLSCNALKLSPGTGCGSNPNVVGFLSTPEWIRFTCPLLFMVFCVFPFLFIVFLYVETLWRRSGGALLYLLVATFFKEWFDQAHQTFPQTVEIQHSLYQEIGQRSKHPKTNQTLKIQLQIIFTPTKQNIQQKHLLARSFKGKPFENINKKALKTKETQFLGI